MKYPDEFVRAVKETFPSIGNLHTALDKGSDTVGNFLNNRRSSVDPRRVIDFIDDGKVQLLRSEAEHLLRVDALYRRWLELPRD
ncbi:MAG: hypothetical protein WCT11_04255 [Candidatus Magasanikbacteria bacterium]